MPKKAFSLIELLISVSIFAVVAGLMTSILTTVLKVNQRESASVETSEQLSFVMQTVSRLIRESSNIEIATSSASSALKLKLRMKDSAKDPTCLYLENQAIKLAEGPDAINPQNCNLNASSSLTSSKVIADKLDFSKISNYPGHDVVSIDIQLTYNSQNPQSQITRNLKSAIARVSAATFDSNLLPGSDMTYDLGFSPNTRWRNAAFSGDLLVSGNVGIGTASPGQKLHVAGGHIRIDNNYGLWSRNAANNTDLNLIYIDSADNMTVGSVSLAGNLMFNTGGAERMRISSSSGNVGIGTATPGAQLHLNVPGGSQPNTKGLWLTDGGQGASPTYGFKLWHDNLGSTNTYFDSLWNSDSSAINFRTKVSGAATNAMTILGSGNVGIGTATPTGKLTIEGTAANENTYFIDIKRTDQPEIGGGIRWRDNTGAVKWELKGSGGGTPSILFTDGVNNLMIVRNNGNVGIGEITPLQKLVVYGNGDGNSGITVKSPYGFRSSYFASDGSLNFNNGTNVGFLNSAGAWINGSDAAYKKNIQDIKYGLNDVLRMKPRAYLMKDTNISQIGFIAQEMREIIPEAVSGMEGNLGISYGQLTSVLTKAIQEQQEQIEELKVEVEKLKAN